MRVLTRVPLFAGLVFAPTLTFGQAIGLPAAGVQAPSPDYAQRAPIDVKNVPLGYAPGSITLDAATGAAIDAPVGSGASNSARPSGSSFPGNDDQFDIDNARPNRSTVDGLDTLATFDGMFVAQAGPTTGRNYRFTMIGNDPRLGGTTPYPANISEVSLQLLNADGTVFKEVPFAPFEKLTLESPNFEPLNYRSGAHIEFADAVHRAEFYNTMKNDWHTLLIPKVKNKVTLSVPYYVNLRKPDGTVIKARAYFSGTASDGNTFVLMLQPLFNFIFDNQVVNEINAGNFTTNGVNSLLFPNTFLYGLNQSNPNLPGSCCVLGFHTYFMDSGFPEPRWVTQYASYISPGLFGGGFEDVTAFSHETSEAFDDPWVDNPTPNWQFPGVPANSKTCQANLEVGDPVEVVGNSTAAIEVKEGKFDKIYHPQNEALYQWFNMGATSSAIDGAYSFPDETALPHSALPCPQ